MFKQTLTGLVLFSALVSNLALAERWQASSGEKQVAVMELFVSEGCGLCPAAERWAKELPKQGFDADKLIVLGFHVDYLNEKKGWTDRFATPRFTDRQQQMARINLYQTVFTPGVFIGGEILHNWQEHGTSAIEFVNAYDAEADITLDVTHASDSLKIDSEIQVHDEPNRQQSKLYLALIEDNIISEIRGGDNMGAVFNHQDLVRRWLGPFELDASGTTKLSTELLLEPEWKQQDLTLVAVVQNLYDGYVLQGLSVPLTE
jgi:hypothetical protein